MPGEGLPIFELAEDRPIDSLDFGAPCREHGTDLSEVPFSSGDRTVEGRQGIIRIGTRRRQAAIGIAHGVPRRS